MIFTDFWLLAVDDVALLELPLDADEEDLLELNEALLLAELFGKLLLGVARVRTARVGDAPESFPARSNAVIV